MSRFGGSFGKRPFPPQMKETMYSNWRENQDKYDRGDFYQPLSRHPGYKPPPVEEDDFSDLPMSPFLERMMGIGPPRAAGVPPRPPLIPSREEMLMDLPSREEILMDLGHSVVSSLKGGQKLSNNPIIREKLKTLLKVEEMEQMPPPMNMSGPSLGPNSFMTGPSRGPDSFMSGPTRPSDSFMSEPRGPHSRYDSYYETGFVPPAPVHPAPPGRGFSAAPKFPLPPLDPFQNDMNDWHKFLRIGKEMDRNRIYASDSELARYFQSDNERRPLALTNQVQTRLKNTFSFEISQTKLPQRRSWLIMHHNKIQKCRILSKTNSLPHSKPMQGIVKKPRRKESERKKEKKRLRDKRPSQSESDRRITNFLKGLMFELCRNENEEHAVLVLRAIATNKNVIKCLMTECNTFLEQKFGTGTDLQLVNTKKDYLVKYHKKHLEETIVNLKALTRPVDDVDNTIYDAYIAALSGIKSDVSMFATPTDYVLEPTKSEDEFIVDFKFDFVRFAFEKFHFKVVETFCVTKDQRKRINFFMNNGFLAGLIWTVAQKKSPQLPMVAMKYMTAMDKPCQENSAKIDVKILKKVLTKPNYEIQTNYLDYTSQKNLLPDQEATFRRCIECFDPKASMIKFQLVDYTPYNPLPREYKIYVFAEIIKFVYLQILELIINSPNLMTKSYTDMETD